MGPCLLSNEGRNLSRWTLVDSVITCTQLLKSSSLHSLSKYARSKLAIWLTEQVSANVIDEHLISCRYRTCKAHTSGHQLLRLHPRDADCCCRSLQALNVCNDVNELRKCSSIKSIKGVCMRRASAITACVTITRNQKGSFSESEIGKTTHKAGV